MHYEGFAGYLEALCDDVYSGSIRAMLYILPMPQMDAQVEAKRAELAEKYGEAWHYEISDVKKTELSAQQCGAGHYGGQGARARADIFGHGSGGE